MLGTALSTSGRHKRWCDFGMTSMGDEAAWTDYPTIANPHGVGLGVLETGVGTTCCNRLLADSF